MRRRSYQAVKIFVADVAERQGVVRTADFLGVPHQTVSDWVRDKGSIAEMPPEKRARRHRVQKKTDLEAHLVDYCREIREKQLPLTLTTLYIEASMANQDPATKISMYWLWKVLKKTDFPVARFLLLAENRIAKKPCRHFYQSMGHNFPHTLETLF